MKWAGTHNGVSRAPLMGFHTRTADDMTHQRYVKALERKRLCETHTPVAIRCQSDALVANQMHYKTRPGHEHLRIPGTPKYNTRNEEESTTA